MKKNLFLIAVIIAIRLTAYAQISLNNPEIIDSFFLQWDKENSPGAAIGIIQDGELIYAKGYGMANLDYNIPLRPDSKFYIASTTKHFTAACIALLSIEGKVGLDDHIRKYIPEIPEYGNDITIRDLIHHTSGLRDYLELMYLSGRSFEDYFTIEDGIKLLARQKSLNFAPGEEHLYSNSNYILLAEIVNRVSGMTIRAYADKYIFQPLGMRDTFFNDDHSKITKNRVISYRKQGRGIFKRFVQNFDALGDGNLLTTIHDMYLWDQNFYNKKVGGKAFIDLMLTRGKLNNGDTLQYAFGLEHGIYRGLKSVSHGGGFLGFRTQYIRFPAYNFSVVVFSNVSDFNPSEKAYRIVDIFLKDKFVVDQSSQTLSKQITSNSPGFTCDQLKKYCASFWNDNWGFSRKIYIKNDTLRFSFNENNENALQPIASNEFKMLGVIIDFKVKFEFDDNKVHKMITIINNGTPAEYVVYEPVSYTNEDLLAYAGLYYSSELNCNYDLKIMEDTLFLYINDNKISRLRPVMKNRFKNDNFGVLSFPNDHKNEFYLSSGRVRNINFIKK